MADEVVEGGCFCGAVRYEARGKPANTMVCHCLSCRRVAGAPVVAWLTFPETHFRITKGKPATFKSSAPVVRSFCPACGTGITYQRETNAGYIDVTTASLDDPNAYPPTHHSWLEDDIGWVKFADGLPVFQRSRPS
jgi:hypothetical protein